MSFTPSRRRLSSQFAQIPNALLRDEGLSARARGVLCYMLSHADGFEITRSLLNSAFTEGREALDTALRELRDAGYVRSIRHQDETGRFTGREYLVFDERGAAEAESEDDISPSDGEAVTRETRTTGNPPPYKNTNSLRTPAFKNTKDISRDFDSIYEDFRATWKAVGVWQAGPKVRAKLEQLVKQGKLAEIEGGLRRLIADPNRPEANFVPRPLTWLNQSRWEDDPYPAPAGRQGAAAQALSVDLTQSPADGGYVSQIGVFGDPGFTNQELLEIEAGEAQAYWSQQGVQR